MCDHEKKRTKDSYFPSLPKKAALIIPLPRQVARASITPSKTRKKLPKRARVSTKKGRNRCRPLPTPLESLLQWQQNPFLLKTYDKTRLTFRKRGFFDTWETRENENGTPKEKKASGVSALTSEENVVGCSFVLRFSSRLFMSKAKRRPSVYNDFVQTTNHCVQLKHHFVQPKHHFDPTQNAILPNQNIILTNQTTILINQNTSCPRNNIQTKPLLLKPPPLLSPRGITLSASCLESLYPRHAWHVDRINHQARHTDNSISAAALA